MPPVYYAHIICQRARAHDETFYVEESASVRDIIGGLNRGGGLSGGWADDEPLTGPSLPQRTPVSDDPGSFPQPVPTDDRALRDRPPVSRGVSMSGYPSGPPPQRLDFPSADMPFDEYADLRAVPPRNGRETLDSRDARDLRDLRDRRYLPETGRGEPPAPYDWPPYPEPTRYADEYAYPPQPPSSQWDEVGRYPPGPADPYGRGGPLLRDTREYRDGREPRPGPAPPSEAYAYPLEARRYDRPYPARDDSAYGRGPPGPSPPYPSHLEGPPQHYERYSYAREHDSREREFRDRDPRDIRDSGYGRRLEAPYSRSPAGGYPDLNRPRHDPYAADVTYGEASAPAPWEEPTRPLPSTLPAARAESQLSGVSKSYGGNKSDSGVIPLQVIHAALRDKPWYL